MSQPRSSSHPLSDREQRQETTATRSNDNMSSNGPSSKARKARKSQFKPGMTVVVNGSRGSDRMLMKAETPESLVVQLLARENNPDITDVQQFMARTAVEVKSVVGADVLPTHSAASFVEGLFRLSIIEEAVLN